MNRVGSFLVLCAMLILSLAACGTTADNNRAARDGATVTERATTYTRTMMNEGKQMMLDAKYYAAPNGRVRGMGRDDLIDDMRSATDKAAKDIRQAGDSMGNALGNMTHK